MISSRYYLTQVWGIQAGRAGVAGRAGRYEWPPLALPTPALLALFQMLVHQLRHLEHVDG